METLDIIALQIIICNEHEKDFNPVEIQLKKLPL